MYGQTVIQLLLFRDDGNKDDDCVDYLLNKRRMRMRKSHKCETKVTAKSTSN